jgi:hypothetical protein
LWIYAFRRADKVDLQATSRSADHVLYIVVDARGGIEPKCSTFRAPVICRKVESKAMFDSVIDSAVSAAPVRIPSQRMLRL